MTYDFPLPSPDGQRLGSWTEGGREGRIRVEGRGGEGRRGGGVEKWAKAKASDAIAGEGGGHDERSEGVSSASASA